MVSMNKYYFIVSKIGRNGKIEQKKVGISHCSNSLEAINRLRAIYSESDYNIDLLKT